MGWTSFFSFLFILFVVVSLVIYWFVPFKTIEFGIQSGGSNFTLGNYDSEMQFYKNMRFPNKEISYKIEDCTLQKQDDMKGAFEIMSDLTTLNFYVVGSNEEISITCDSKTKIEGGMFIAGEGGPTNVTQSEKFNVISHGKILLIRDSKCERPNVALHELLHVLGFDHSSNINNIMYNVSKCDQTIGEDIPELLNNLYSIPSYPDLSFENVSAVMNGRYLDINMVVRNMGLKDSQDSELLLYAGDKLVKEINLEPIDIGSGRMVFLSNLLINKISVDELKVIIDYSFDELDKENNEIILKIKK